MLALAALGFTPYEPSANWTYYIEAERGGAWPTCSYRFLSYTASGSTVDLWDAVGVNQEVTLEPVESASRTFRLRLNGCGRYLSVASDCANTAVGTAVAATGGAKENGEHAHVHAEHTSTVAPADPSTPGLV